MFCLSGSLWILCCLAGVDEKGLLMDRGIDKIAANLNGTDSHENKHEVRALLD